MKDSHGLFEPSGYGAGMKFAERISRQRLATVDSILFMSFAFGFLTLDKNV